MVRSEKEFSGDRPFNLHFTYSRDGFHNVEAAQGLVAAVMLDSERVELVRFEVRLADISPVVILNVRLDQSK